MDDRNMKALLRHLEERMEDVKFASENLKDTRVGKDDLVLIWGVLEAFQRMEEGKSLFGTQREPTLEELVEFGHEIESDTVQINWEELLHV